MSGRPLQPVFFGQLLRLQTETTNKVLDGAFQCEAFWIRGGRRRISGQSMRKMPSATTRFGGKTFMNSRRSGYTKSRYSAPGVAPSLSSDAAGKSRSVARSSRMTPQDQQTSDQALTGFTIPANPSIVFARPARTLLTPQQEDAGSANWPHRARLISPERRPEPG